MSKALTNLLETQAAFTHTIKHFTWVRNVMMGAGMAYAIEKEKFWHLPFVFLIPSPYAGYQAYKNRSSIKEYIGI